MNSKAIHMLSSQLENRFSPSLVSITPNAIGKSDVAENQRRQNLFSIKTQFELLL